MSGASKERGSTGEGVDHGRSTRSPADPGRGPSSESPTDGRPELAQEDRQGEAGSGDGPEDATREGSEHAPSRGPGGLVTPVVDRTPLFTAHHSERYGRQQLIKRYEEDTGARLIVLIDSIFEEGMTYLEELLFDLPGDRPLHLLLASPGGSGETAIRMVRSMQSRCTELTILLPDMAKSAATLMCLGADRLIVGPGGDLGPVDPQFQIKGSLVGAKDIVDAVDEAEDRITRSPDTFPLFANLLADVNMMLLRQARNALEQSEALVRDALSCGHRTADDVDALTERLKGPLIGEPATHSAVISAASARELGLPARDAEIDSPEWRLVWNLWTRYYALGCYPVGPVAAYEAQRASHILPPPAPPGTHRTET